MPQLAGASEAGTPAAGGGIEPSTTIGDWAAQHRGKAVRQVIAASKKTERMANRFPEHERGKKEGKGTECGRKRRKRMRIQYRLARRHGSSRRGGTMVVKGSGFGVVPPAQGIPERKTMPVLWVLRRR
jgi:hypothetical protein